MHSLHNFMVRTAIINVFLLLIGHSDASKDCLYIEEDIALGLTEVIYKHQNEQGRQHFGILLAKIADELPEAIRKYYEIYNPNNNYKSCVSAKMARKHLKTVPKLRDQVEKLFISIELRKMIEEMKTGKSVEKEAKEHPRSPRKHQNEGHGQEKGKSVLEEEMGLREKIKTTVFANVQQNGLKIPKQGKEKEKAIENLKEIISILLFFHEDDLVEMETGEKRKHEKSKNPLRIAILSPNFTQTPPRKYGGTERIVSYLSEELIKRGHDVTLFASSDSITSAKLVFKEPALFLTDVAKLDDTHEWLMGQIEKGVAAGQFDFVHLNSDFQWENVSKMADKIALAATIHFLIKSPELAPLGYEYTNIPLISISNDQRNHQPSVLPVGTKWHPNFIRTIYHGLPGDMYKFVSADEMNAKLAQPDFPYGPNPYLSFLGRISPPKRPDIAIRIAAIAGTPLRMAAAINKEHQLYWVEGIKPLISLVNGQHRQKRRSNESDEKLHKTQMDAQHRRIRLVGDYLNELANFNGIEEKNKETIQKLTHRYENDLTAFKNENVELLREIGRYEREEEKLSKNEKRKALVEYVGEVTDDQKNDFLGNSLAMLFPIYWNEPFGLVMIEAMAMGTPVITRSIGSVGEVIKNHKAGIIYGPLKDGCEEAELEAAKKAVEDIGQIDRSGVRAEFDGKFTVAKMTDGYEELFQDLVAKMKAKAWQRNKENGQVEGENGLENLQDHHLKKSGQQINYGSEDTEE